MEDDGWFFDTEMLWLADRIGLRVHEVPVDWVDDPDSRVDIGPTARADLAGIVRLRRRQLSAQLPLAELRERFGRHPLTVAADAAANAGAQLASFALVGALSFLAYLLLFVLLRAGSTAQEANLGALLITTVGNTAANRRWTFRVRGRTGAGRAQLQGLLVFAARAGADQRRARADACGRPSGTAPVEIAVLVMATAVGTVVRFALFRLWIFRPAGASGAAARPTAVCLPSSRATSTS